MICALLCPCECCNVDSFPVLKLDLPIRWDLFLALVGQLADASSSEQWKDMLSGFDTIINRVHMRALFPEDVYAALCGTNEVCRYNCALALRICLFLFSHSASTNSFSLAFSL